MACLDFVFEHERLLVVARSTETFHRIVSTGLLNLLFVARVMAIATVIYTDSDIYKCFF
ncbi:MAG: hypothetical protein LH702_33440 [Phormidesmis sp. CAN_BIN44]|nr:hypothetical protein [Phormidesmis sp. CAN_BIN44]